MCNSVKHGHFFELIDIRINYIHIIIYISKQINFNKRGRVGDMLLQVLHLKIYKNIPILKFKIIPKLSKKFWIKVKVKVNSQQSIVDWSTQPESWTKFKTLMRGGLVQVKLTRFRSWTNPNSNFFALFFMRQPWPPLLPIAVAKWLQFPAGPYLALNLFFFL